MDDKAVAEAKRVIESVLHAEELVSIGSYKEYNAFVEESDSVLSVSASGRVMRGSEEVKAATAAVAQGNAGEENRSLEFLACDGVDDLIYAVVKTSVDILKQEGPAESFCWVITLIMRKRNGTWYLAHRQNTRSDKD